MGHLVLNYGAQRVEVLSCVIHSENISLLFESDEIAEKTLHHLLRDSESHHSLFKTCGVFRFLRLWGPDSCLCMTFSHSGGCVSI